MTDLASNERRFVPAYVGRRDDLLALLPTTCRSILDVGCATGTFGFSVKEQRPNTRVVGVELDPQMANLARTRLDAVVEADLNDVERVKGELGPERFDCIVFGDVLEHLFDPWLAMKELSTALEEGGYLLVSLPNIGHISTVASVMFRRRWPYRDVGIHDRTHVRFFALENIKALFADAGFEICRIRRNYRVIERGHRIDRLARFLAIPGLRSLLTFQYVVLGRRRAANSGADREPRHPQAQT